MKEKLKGAGEEGEDEDYEEEELGDGGIGPGGLRHGRRILLRLGDLMVMGSDVMDWTLGCDVLCVQC